MFQEKRSMISYENALTTIIEKTKPSPTIKKPLLEALGHVAAGDVTSLIQVPSFRNSAMDGFAVVHSQIASASQAKPITLPIATTIAAGEVPAAFNATQTVQIMTGAIVPEPYDTIVPVEQVSIHENCVTFTAPAHCGNHIRHIGEDVTKGQVVLRKGKRITPETIMLLAAVGINTLETTHVPPLHILSTGNEICDNYTIPLSGTQIYNSNAPYLLAEARKQGLEVYYEGTVPDSPISFETKLKTIDAPAIIISTGAVSKGVWDFIPKSLTKLGAITHFHCVNIRPGKPILFASLPNGNYYFGLPGNPISAAIGFTFFVMPLVRALQGIIQPGTLTAKLCGKFSKKGDFYQFLKARLALDSNGQLTANISDGQESFKISPMAANNAWVVLEDKKREWLAGDIVPVIPYGEIIATPKQY